MTQLPVREMVLYKHGVGFFVRQGKTDAQEVMLTFRHDEINDVLKSLAVFDHAGGQVLGIHYRTPMDKQARLADGSIRLSDSGSVRDLLRDLRGRQVTLDFETTPGTVERITGRVVGLDSLGMTSTRFGTKSDDLTILAAIQDDSGRVVTFDFLALRAVTLHDTQSAHDLTYFLDSSMVEETRRTVNVRLSEGAHDLVVYYVAPSPTWRVSYRIVADSSKDGKTGTALLQGWGVFDNRLEEDLEDVRVTLVAGQPISFIYDLYESRIPQRPVVKDESRVAPGPVEFDGSEIDEMLPDERHFLMARATVHESHAILGAARAMSAPPPAPKMKRERMAQMVSADTETKDAGEFFQYLVNTPVSVKRGESALVPIIGSEVQYARELLYNGNKFPTHPVASLRFINTTGLTLERGPVTVVEDGDYKGDAVIAFTKDSIPVHLPYAVELGIKVTERPRNYTQTAGLHIEGGYLVYEEQDIHQRTYLIENTTGAVHTVIIEERITSIDAVLFDTPTPDVQTANERRWKVDVPARGNAEFTWKTRTLRLRHQELRKMTYQNLQNFVERQWLDKKTLKQLSELLGALERIQEAKKRIHELDIEKDDIYRQQEQFRANMQALNPTGDEAALRKRIVRQLELSQDRLDEIMALVGSLEQKIIQEEEKAAYIIKTLEEPKTL